MSGAAALLLALAAAPAAQPVLNRAAPFVAAPASTASSLLASVMALALVLGLILALAWLLRRMPGNAFNGSPGLRPVASLALGPKERLVVVEVGGEQLLLGVTPAGIQRLHQLPQPLAEPAPTVDFAALLARRLRAGKDRAA